jgi:LPXTG-motif cell wall-anchored protein
MRRLRRCSVAVLLAPLLATAFAAAPAQAAEPDPVVAAASWLSTQFVGDSHLPGPAGTHFESKFGASYFPNYGENADVLFALAAAKVGATKAKVALGYLNAHLADYADPSGAFGGPFDGSLAKVALARIVAGTSADDLLTTLKADECPSGSATCTPGAPANIFASASDSFVILAEARAGGSFAPSADAVAYFLSLQCANGGFTTGTTACGSGAADIDATSYALMALQVLGGHAAEAAKAADWLMSQQKPAGYWISQKIPNTNSTGLAAAALAGAGRDVTTARAWLLDQAIGGGLPGAGSLKYGGAFAPTTLSATSTSVLATAQGVLGLSKDGSLATVTAAGSSAGVELLQPTASLRPKHQTVGAKATAHAVGFAPGEHVKATVAGKTVGGGTVDASGIVDITFTVPASAAHHPLFLLGTASGLGFTLAFHLVESGGADAGPPPPTSSEPPLANTGSHTSELMSVGLASLLAGAGLVALARQRRRGRHAA